MKTFLGILILMTQVFFLPGFNSRTNLKLYDAFVTPKLVTEYIIDFDSSRVFVFGCIPVLVLTNCGLELSYILGKLFNMCLKEY